MKIELKKWKEENKNDLIRICNSVDRKYLSGRLPYPYTEESADWWYANVVSGDGKNGIFRAISVDGIIVGSISVEMKSDVYAKDAEIGYMLLSEYYGKGITTEASLRICDIAFAELDIERLTGYVCSPNIASQKVLLKSGFELEGLMKRAVCKDGNMYDLYIYGKCKTK